jgi:alkanesulfonate monooxygenase SsuD/methylene tetrahydromethanopterin reductase-like flavin-dependent oxidoreductase (luciferase family)
VADSQMIWSDCYATLALAAYHTSRIRLGTGVAVAGTRIAPVTAHSIASINRIAPGRTFLTLGTGHTAMRVMGMNPMALREFREYVRVVQRLLHGDEVEYRLGGVTRPIRFLDHSVINLEDPIPVYVAANAPRALRLAGELGDGVMSVGNGSAEAVHSGLENVRAGAARAGRQLPDDFAVAMLTTAVLLKPGEKLTAERVIDESAPLVTSALHWTYENWKQTGNDAVIAPAFRAIWEEYCAYVDRMKTPPDRRYLQIHLGHCTEVVPAERRFITPEAIRAAVMVGEPEELITAIREAERAGLTDLNLMPPRACARKVLKEFAEQIMARY